MGATIVAYTPFDCFSSCGCHNTADDQGPRDASSVSILSQQPGNSGTAIKSEDTSKKATVAVPELQRIQELHRVILTGVDVFAQARFPNLHLTGEGFGGLRIYNANLPADTAWQAVAWRAPHPVSLI